MTMYCNISFNLCFFLAGKFVITVIFCVKKLHASVVYVFMTVVWHPHNCRWNVFVILFFNDVLKIRFSTRTHKRLICKCISINMNLVCFLIRITKYTRHNLVSNQDPTIILLYKNVCINIFICLLSRISIYSQHKKKNTNNTRL